MRERDYDEERPYTWIVNAFALVFAGGLIGYVLAIQGARPAAPPSPAAPVPAPSSTAPIADEGALRAYRDILARDPKNLVAAVNAGNLLYDAQRYVEAIPFYQQAFALKPSDINVSTDLGTALWYAGRPDDALSQYDRSLAIDATHPQTLFNVGIVRADGKGDYPGAIAAWEKLIAAHPEYTSAAAARERIASARTKITVDVRPQRSGG
jgi:Flp pilus assembly protein TadD